jgi:hypothetical protein
MSLAQFIGVLVVLGLVFNVVVIYLYFKKEVSDFFRGRSVGDKKIKFTKKEDSRVGHERVLVGATRENNLDYIPRESHVPAIPSEQPIESQVTKEFKSFSVDNSFSTDDLEMEMGKLGQAILRGSDSMQTDNDVLAQISRSGILKVGIKTGGQASERSVMVLENTIVL